jgi:hypothetical protein
VCDESRKPGNVAKFHRSTVSNPDLQFYFSLAVGILFGVVGVAGAIPILFAVVALAASMLVASWALWRSQGLAGKTSTMRGLIVLIFGVIYCSAAYPAVTKLIREHRESATQPAIIQNATDCASNVIGDGNKVSVNCDDKSKK